MQVTAAALQGLRGECEEALEKESCQRIKTSKRSRGDICRQVQSVVVEANQWEAVESVCVCVCVRLLASCSVGRKLLQLSIAQTHPALQCLFIRGVTC